MKAFSVMSHELFDVILNPGLKLSVKQVMKNKKIKKIWVDGGKSVGVVMREESRYEAINKRTKA